MSQVVKRGNTKPLPLNAGYSVNTYRYTGEVVGGSSQELFVNGKQGYVVALEPSTAGLIEVTAVLSEVNTNTGVPGTSRYQKIVGRYEVNRVGTGVLSLGGDTYGSVTSPATPINTPSNRLSTALTVSITNRSATEYYPHLVVSCGGTIQTNNWLIEVKVFTLPFKGA